MVEHEIFFEEAEPEDAQSIIEFMKDVAHETDAIVLEEDDFPLNHQQMAVFLDDSLCRLDQLCFVAKMNGDIIGLINVRTARTYTLSHIGDVFIAVKKAYWGHGLGRILLEETVEWARRNQVLKRLELTVQVQNERAVNLYHSVDFAIEGTKKRGARTIKGEWLDLYYMGLLIDEDDNW
ncbi:GNAT family N-acetyltransferase [Streptococcus sp. X16XC17]|uniref:GNAT family N-acetyltransferase n=1 Tax=Streptococcus sp. X16XC17 TaxID=2316646 RepID=UPI00104072B7|nr:GNAT family N-acetyltransferase [Streptococcus sp. X16XC17]TCD45660.1 GNAT family N-acetyltransferase [Streptococcus sp. X16XC17]